MQIAKEIGIFFQNKVCSNLANRGVKNVFT